MWARGCGRCGREQPRRRDARRSDVRGRMATVSVGLSLTLHGVVAWRMAARGTAGTRVERPTIEVETFVTPAPAAADVAPARGNATRANATRANATRAKEA